MVAPDRVRGDVASVDGGDSSTYSDEWGRLGVVPGQRRHVPGVQPSVAFVASDVPSLADGVAGSESGSPSEYTLFGTPIVDESQYGDSMSVGFDARAGSSGASPSEYTLFGTPIVDESLYGDSMAVEFDARHLVVDGAQHWMVNVLAFLHAEVRSLEDAISTTASGGVAHVRDFGSESTGVDGDRPLGGSD